MSDSSSPLPISEQVEELMAEYLLNPLDPAVAAEFERQLQAHPAIAPQLQAWQEVMGLIAHATPPIAAPASLRTAILAAATEPIAPPVVIPSVIPASSQRSVPLRCWHWDKIAALAATFLLIAFGIDNYFLRRKLDRITTSVTTLQQSESHLRQNVLLMDTTVNALQGSQTQLFTLRGAKAAQTAAGSVILDVQNGVALLALQNLPTLPADQEYHLWAFTDDQKILCGKFNTQPDGRIVDKIAIAKSQFTQAVRYLRISKESATIPPDPTKKALVMTSEI